MGCTESEKKGALHEHSLIGMAGEGDQSQITYRAVGNGGGTPEDVCQPVKVVDPNTKQKRQCQGL